MNIERLTLTFFLPECHSLKTKRQALAGLKERFGRLPWVAVLESDFQDQHQRAQWSFLVLGRSYCETDRQCCKIEQWIVGNVDALVTDCSRERL
jgi:uncharacterized protein YlxP (DUF503 family)